MCIYIHIYVHRPAENRLVRIVASGGVRRAAVLSRFSSLCLYMHISCNGLGRADFATCQRLLLSIASFCPASAGVCLLARLPLPLCVLLVVHIPLRPVESSVVYSLIHAHAHTLTLTHTPTHTHTHSHTHSLTHTVGLLPYPSCTCRQCRRIRLGCCLFDPFSGMDRPIDGWTLKK